MNKIYICIILLILALPHFGNCKPKETDPKYAIPKTAQSIDSSGLTEAKAYKMLYDNQVKANDAVLKTIFYALGGLASAMVLVFASNWWFNEKKVIDLKNGINFQINEAKSIALNEVDTKFNSFATDKTLLISNLQIRLQEEVTNSNSNTVARFNEFTEKIRAEIKEDNKSLLMNYQKQLDSFNENYRQQLTNMNESITSLNNSVVAKVDGAEEKLKNYFSRKVGSLERQIVRNEFYMWKHRGILSNALLSQIEELNLILKNPKETRNFEWYLKQISETLSGMQSIPSQAADDLTESINQIPEEFQPAKEDTLKLLLNLQKTA